MTTLYIIRHGETEPNTRFACLGRLDVPLNETGKKQARELCGRIDVKPDAVYISPLSRAYETVAQFCEMNPEIPVIKDQGLTERDYGEWDNMSFKEIEAADPERYGLWQNDFTGYTVPGGESSAAVQERVNESMKAILSENDGRTVFVVTHLGTARHIISYCLNLTLEESWRFTMNNAAMAVIEYDNAKKCGVLKYLNI